LKQDHFDCIPGACHALIDQPERVNQRILELLGKGDGSLEGLETS
jgi:hypothetical protein